MAPRESHQAPPPASVPQPRALKLHRPGAPPHGYAQWRPCPSVQRFRISATPLHCLCACFLGCFGGFACGRDALACGPWQLTQSARVRIRERGWDSALLPSRSLHSVLPVCSAAMTDDRCKMLHVPAGESVCKRVATAATSDVRCREASCIRGGVCSRRSRLDS